MEHTATVGSKCFFVNRNRQRDIMMDKKAVTHFSSILKDCLVMSVVVMTGAALTLLLG